MEFENQVTARRELADLHRTGCKYLVIDCGEDINFDVFRYKVFMIENNGENINAIDVTAKCINAFGYDSVQRGGVFITSSAWNIRGHILQDIALTVGKSIGDIQMDYPYEKSIIT